MDSTRDADGFAVPGPPLSTGSRPRANLGSASSADTGFSSGSSRSFGKSLVEDPFYRDMNLAANNIYLRSSREQFPEHVSDLIDHVRRDRDSPEPSQDQVRQDDTLEGLRIGSVEAQVEDYFGKYFFLEPAPNDVLGRARGLPMARHTVPNSGSHLKVSNPAPDMLFGYDRGAAFPEQQAQLISMGVEMVANSQSLLYPFFVIEFKAVGPSGSGSLWAAVNQCLGAAAACVNVTERLQHRLRTCQVDHSQPINTASFSIAMTGTEAQLYVSWKHDERNYYMANVRSFLLHDPEHYIEFRKYVRNILDWGKDRRLNEIRDSLHILMEESRKKGF